MKAEIEKVLRETARLHEALVDQSELIERMARTIA